MPKYIDLTGKCYGSLVVMRKTDIIKYGNITWECKCDCGKTTIVTTYNLTSGRIRSCGCLQSKLLSEHTIERCTKHGLRKDRLYPVWQAMKQRCNNPNNEDYKDYGARGITVCKEWKDSFQIFYDYVSKLPHFGEKGYTLDRINNDGNYEPGNVKWSTRKEQRANQRPRKYSK